MARRKRKKTGWKVAPKPQTPAERRSETIKLVGIGVGAANLVIRVMDLWNSR